MLCLFPWLMFIGKSDQDPSNEMLFFAATLLVTLPISICVLFLLAHTGDVFSGSGTVTASLLLVVEWVLFVGAAYWQWTRLVPFLWKQMLGVGRRLVERRWA